MSLRFGLIEGKDFPIVATECRLLVVALKYDITIALKAGVSFCAYCVAQSHRKYILPVFE